MVKKTIIKGYETPTAHIFQFSEKVTICVLSGQETLHDDFDELDFEWGITNE